MRLPILPMIILIAFNLPGRRIYMECVASSGMQPSCLKGICGLIAVAYTLCGGDCGSSAEARRRFSAVGRHVDALQLFHHLCAKTGICAFQPVGHAANAVEEAYLPTVVTDRYCCGSFYICCNVVGGIGQSYKVPGKRDYSMF